MTRSSSRAAVLVDTDVFSILYIDPVKAANRGLPVEQLRAQLAGLQVVIAFQTRAEVLAGAMVGSWGERKLADTRAKLDSAPTISIDSGVVDAYASLTAACRRVGHALHDKIHTGDRWIAACAISKEVPLLSLDGIYAGAPDLALLGG
ncbi:MAG: PIN domain-containing protein [Rhodococcus sp. (in: high G+C Gram-positive bacteria)]|uniref:PIN domain-containing protein n=1 Tax=unclassified Rhodococcus (in: high G+C Gram-positive bacteria) TaxID=192944 RepID=UPI000EF8A325|nr:MULTISPECIES: PIN domain-containing protein [unclassified Rhodococcus (in: high G+C Gram-positive bacteria)]RMB78200.1 PIN domain-containing protein [Rhodococcus sp. SBT000017]